MKQSFLISFILFFAGTSVFSQTLTTEDKTAAKLKDVERLYKEIQNTSKKLENAESEYKNCLDKADNESSMQSCASSALSETNKLTYDAYSTLIARVALEIADIENNNELDIKNYKTIRSATISSQKAWQNYRDLNCSWQGTTMIGGSGEHTIVMGCSVDMTVERTKALVNYYEAYFSSGV